MAVVYIENLKGKMIKEATFEKHNKTTKVTLYFTDDTYCVLDVNDYNDGINLITKNIKYRFKSSLFGKQILQIGHFCQDWDTSLNRSIGPQYIKWYNANDSESKNFLRRLKAKYEK